ncbi:MAG: hypothetical protein AAFZ15_24735 [Bacteroidota bacterium]
MGKTYVITLFLMAVFSNLFAQYKTDEVPFHFSIQVPEANKGKRPLVVILEPKSTVKQYVRNHHFLDHAEAFVLQIIVDTSRISELLQEKNFERFTQQIEGYYRSYPIDFQRIYLLSLTGGQALGNNIHEFARLPDFAAQLFCVDRSEIPANGKSASGREVYWPLEKATEAGFADRAWKLFEKQYLWGVELTPYKESKKHFSDSLDLKKYKGLFDFRVGIQPWIAVTDNYELFVDGERVFLPSAANSFQFDLQYWLSNRLAISGGFGFTFNIQQPDIDPNAFFGTSDVELEVGGQLTTNVQLGVRYTMNYKRLRPYISLRAALQNERVFYQVIDDPGSILGGGGGRPNLADLNGETIQSAELLLGGGFDYRMSKRFICHFGAGYSLNHRLRGEIESSNNDRHVLKFSLGLGLLIGKISKKGFWK